MGAQLEIVKADDGSLHLVGEVDGVKHSFATLNASQVNADAIEQEKAQAPENASAAHLGAYTGPADDVTPSAHLTGETVSSSGGGDGHESDLEPETQTTEPETT